MDDHIESISSKITHNRKPGRYLFVKGDTKLPNSETEPRGSISHKETPGCFGTSRQPHVT